MESYRNALILFMSGEYWMFFWGLRGENLSFLGWTILSGDDCRSRLEFMSGESNSLPLSVSILRRYRINHNFMKNSCACFVTFFLFFPLNNLTPRIIDLDRANFFHGIYHLKFPFIRYNIFSFIINSIFKIFWKFIYIN